MQEDGKVRGAKNVVVGGWRRKMRNRDGRWDRGVEEHGKVGSGRTVDGKESRKEMGSVRKFGAATGQISKR